MGIRDTFIGDTSLKVSHVVLPDKECDIIKLKTLVSDSCLQKILENFRSIRLLTLFVGDSLGVESFPPNQLLGLSMVWIFIILIHRNLVGCGN